MRKALPTFFRRPERDISTTRRAFGPPSKRSVPSAARTKAAPVRGENSRFTTS